MFNRKIAISAVSILAAMALLGGSAFAVFSSSAASTANTFTTGNANLMIAPDVAGNPGTFVSSIAGPSFGGLAPGDSEDFDFWLKNVSSANVSLDLTGDVSAISTDPNNLDSTLLIKWTCDTDHDNSLGDEISSSEFSPRDWLNGGNTALSALTQNQQMFCRMTGTLPLTADNTVSGQNVIFDAIYNGTQL